MNSINHLKLSIDNDKLLLSLNKLYKSFSYLGITEDEFNDIVLSSIDNPLILNVDNLTYEELFIGRINLKLSEMVRESIHNSSLVFDLVNNYINNIRCSYI